MGKRKGDLEVAPPSQDVIALENSTKARRLRQHARCACYPGEELGTSVSRSGTSNTEHPTPNAEEKERLGGGAAEGAGERRSDAGGDDDLLGRFFRLHLFAAAWGDSGRRIQHPAMLDDLLDL